MYEFGFAQGSSKISSNEIYWKRHTIDDSLSGADGVRLADVNSDLDILTCEKNSGKLSQGLGVIWYENPLY